MLYVVISGTNKNHKYLAVRVVGALRRGSGQFFMPMGANHVIQGLSVMGIPKCAFLSESVTYKGSKIRTILCLVIITWIIFVIKFNRCLWQILHNTDTNREAQLQITLSYNLNYDFLIYNIYVLYNIFLSIYLKYIYKETPTLYTM